MQPVDTDTRDRRLESRHGAWFLLGALAAIGVGGLAAVLNLARFAPAGLLPIFVGVVLGAVLIGLAAITRVQCRKRLLWGAVVLAMMAVLAEHAWLYRDFRRQWHEARSTSPHLAMFRAESPWSPAEYLRHEATAGRVAFWCVDAALVIAFTAGVVSLGRRTLK